MTKIISDTSVNNIKNPGIYGSFSFLDAPQNAIGVSLLVVISYGPSYFIQLFFVIDGGPNFHFRTYNNGYSSWTKIV